MSGAWGTSWGDAWGDSWGAVVVVEVAVRPPGGGNAKSVKAKGRKLQRRTLSLSDEKRLRAAVHLERRGVVQRILERDGKRIPLPQPQKVALAPETPSGLPVRVFAGEALLVSRAAFEVARLAKIAIKERLVQRVEAQTKRAQEAAARAELERMQQIAEMRARDDEEAVLVLLLAA